MQTNRKYNKGKVQNLRHVFYFGNELIPEDTRAVELVKKISEKMPEINFIHCSSPEEIFKFDEKEIIILDVASEIKKPVVIDNLDMLKDRKITTLHDFDLTFFLKIFSKFNRIKIKIVAIPENVDCSMELINMLNHMNSSSRK